MENLVRIIAESLVDHPDQVTVQIVEKNGTTVIELRVADEDMGKVIGKQGRIAKAIRSVVKAAAVKHGGKVNVDIIEG